MITSVASSVPLALPPLPTVSVSNTPSIDRASETSVLEQLVRDPAGFAERVRSAQPATLIRTLLITVALGAGVFGGVIGSYRGGRQIAYCAAKLPMVLIGTLVICTPAFV